jgi:UDP-N-acetylglucosamine 4-epimerase
MTHRIRYEEVQEQLRAEPSRWLVTGCAGFIGSNVLEKLLLLNQTVVGLDNFSTGSRSNLEEVRSSVSPNQWARFHFREGDIIRLEDCRTACAGADFVLHQAALGSVPRSLEDPLRSHINNVDGTINLLEAARGAGVSKFIYASSSSVYGDHPALPKTESKIGAPLSPYAATKRICELYADVFQRSYGLQTIGLRYFNVFGPRQNPNGPYAAVIPQWIAALLRKNQVSINGDGEGSRDFCYVKNVIQANLLSAVSSNTGVARLYNVGCGKRTTLNQLFEQVRAVISRDLPLIMTIQPNYRQARPGDVRDSLADIRSISQELGYQATHSLIEGLHEAYPWYRKISQNN